MQLKNFQLEVQDEEETFEYRRASFDKKISESDTKSKTSLNEDRNRPDTEVSILNLPSLKKVTMNSKPPSEKMKFILADKQRLNTWIKNYKDQFEKTSEKDSVKIDTFREAATRLKMALDASDFDEGDLRIERRKAIEGINNMLNAIGRL